MTALSIVISPDDLESLIRRAVREEMQRERPDEWLSIKDYAKHVNKSANTVRRYIRAGELETRDVCGTIQVRV